MEKEGKVSPNEKKPYFRRKEKGKKRPGRIRGRDNFLEQRRPCAYRPGTGGKGMAGEESAGPFRGVCHGEESSVTEQRGGREGPLVSDEAQRGGRD